MPGRPSGNSTSTTGPTTWTTLPLFIPAPGFEGTRSPSLGLAAGDVEQLLRDVALAQLVVVERQVLDQAVRGVGRVLHRHHARALLAGLGVEQDLADEDVQVVA